MCGIVGYLGKQNAKEIILSGLAKLEYRGYDSAGLAVVNENLKIKKSLGQLINLKKICDQSMDAHLGIGHTRWATHGKPSEINAHPHYNKDGSIAVVHNGIIENFQELKEELQNLGYEFISETDTEVIPHLIDYYYHGDLWEAVNNAISRLQGAYALLVISLNHPDQLIAVRQDSPLVLGIVDDGYIFASDICALLEYTKEVIFVDNGDKINVVNQEMTIYDEHNEKVQRVAKHINLDAASTSKGHYDYYMLKEIYEQPYVLEQTFRRSLNKQGFIDLEYLSITPEQFAKFDKIYMVACGTAYHACLLGKVCFEKYLNKMVICDVASEFRYNKNFVDDKSLVILVSQSGETADTLAVLRDAKAKKAHVLAITNVVSSTIAREADDVMYTLAGMEISVASTKAYTSQVLSLYLLGVYYAYALGKLNLNKYHKIMNQMMEIPGKINEILAKEDQIKDIANKIYEQENAFFIGRGADYYVAREGALKLKEISYIYTEAIASGELKHGTIALIENQTLVVALAFTNDMVDKMISNVEEVKARGAQVFAITSQAGKNMENADYNFIIGDTSKLLAPLLAVVPLQLLAYHVTVLKGYDVDKPRNLAKSVTVE